MYKVLIVSAAANMIWQFNKHNIEILQQQGGRSRCRYKFSRPWNHTKGEVEKMTSWMKRTIYYIIKSILKEAWEPFLQISGYWVSFERSLNNKILILFNLSLQLVGFWRES